MDVHFITSLDGAGLEPYRALRGSREHQRRGIFLAEGEKIVRRLLESPLTVVSMLLPEKWLEAYRPILEQRQEDIPIYVAPKALLEQMTGFSFYQGVLGVGRIPAELSLDALLVQSSTNPLLLTAVDGISNAQNLGTLVRNCAAFGVDGLIVGETSCSPYLSGAVRSSMGMIFQLPMHNSANLADTLDALKARGVRSIAAHPHTEQRTLSQADFRESSCIVFGSEGHGVSRPVLERCDESVAIPMARGIDSLNVASAAAVFFYEANRQRGKA